MTNKDIPLDAAKQLGTDGLLLLMIKTMNDQNQGMEDMGKKIDTFIQVIDSKVGRDEFAIHVHEGQAFKKEIDRRLDGLEELNKTESDSKKAITSLGKNIWKIITGAIILIQFIALAFQAGQGA